MPRHRAPGVCPQPGCSHDQPCPDHTPKPWANSDRRGRLPVDWERRRQAVFIRDRHTCQACGGQRCGNTNLECDHIVPGDDHRLTNLQTLGARPCHEAKTLAERHQAPSPLPPTPA